MIYTYLAGGIAGLTDSECNDWRSYAKQHLKTDTLDPMRRDYRGKEYDPEIASTIVLNDLEDIQRSDYLLVNATRSGSWGTAMEIALAHTDFKFIVAFVGNTGKVSPWIRHHCNYVVETIDEAIAIINSDQDKEKQNG